MCLKSSYSHKLCATVALVSLAGTPLPFQEFVVGLVFTFLIWSHAEYLSVLKILARP